MTRGLPPDYYPADLEPVPSVPELASMGLARVVERTRDGKPSVYSVTPDGTAMINAIMTRNAERMRARHKS